jgi:radical SAM superfamily enzyme YgiQ (UPF0313 family)
MKIRLIYPRFKKFLEDHPGLRESLKKYIVGDYTMPPSLALPIIAAMTPPEIDIRLTDDNIGQPIDYDEEVDLVAISCFTPQAQRAYEIADRFREHGKTVLMGGMHPTTIPHEALLHADSICIGEAETVWHRILEDVRGRKLQRRYESETAFDLRQMPVPKREIFSGKQYQWNAHLVLTMRGCPVKCAACPVPYKEGTMFRFRPVGDIIEDIKQMPYKEFYITDDMIMLPGKRNRKFLESVMERTSELDISIFLSATMTMMADDYSFYTKLRKGNVTSMYTVFGFDTVSKILFSKECPKDIWRNNVDIVRKIEDNGIHFFASYGIGFDDQDKGVIERILRFSRVSGIDLAEFFIATPFPGTPFGIQAEKENRILHRNYSLWNQANVVFIPRHFTPGELMDGFFRLWESFYQDKNHIDTTRSFHLAQTR